MIYTVQLLLRTLNALASNKCVLSKRLKQSALIVGSQTKSRCKFQTDGRAGNRKSL